MVETTARQLIISGLLFSGLLAGIFILISLGVNEETSADFGAANDTLNKFTDLKENAETIRNGFPDAKPATGALGILNGLIEVSWGSLKSTWGAFDTMNAVLSDMSEGALGFPIPSWFTGTIIAILGIALAFSLMAAWFKWRI